jgi:hypothetical protein
MASRRDRRLGVIVFSSLGVAVASWTGGPGARAGGDVLGDHSPDGGTDASPSTEAQRRSDMVGTNAVKRAPCERLRLHVDKGISATDVERVRKVLALKSSEVVISVMYADRRHSRLEVTSNHGTRCLSYGSVYTFTRTKAGWRWLRDEVGGVVY